MNGRLVLALVFLVGGAGLAFAGAQPQAALNPSQALAGEPGHARVKGAVDAVDRDDGTFVLAGGGDSLTVDADTVPTAVRPGNSLLAEGELVDRGGQRVLVADELQLGCPSKYEA